MLKSLHLATVLVLGALHPLAAASIYINDPGTTTNGVFTGTGRGEARFRVDNNNWDLALGNTVPGSAVTANVGNLNQLRNVDYYFSLTHNPNGQLTFRVQNSVTNAVTTLNFLLSNPDFNVIRIQGTATAQPTRSTRINDLQFAIGCCQVYGDTQGLANLLITPSTPAGGLPTFPGDAAGTKSNWIVSDTNLGTLAWRLTGTVRFGQTTNQNPSENLKMSITLGKYTIVNFGTPAIPEVPEPRTYLLMGTGLCAMVLLGRRVRR